MYSEKANKFDEIFTFSLKFLSDAIIDIYVFVAFSEFMNFTYLVLIYILIKHQKRPRYKE